MATSTPPAIVFSDWDGTITSLDSNDYLTDNLGFGQAKRKELNVEIIAGRLTFRDAFIEMLDSIDTPFSECIEILKQNIPLDPGFKDFYEWCESQNIPVVVVSSGMMPIIKALLVSYLGEGVGEKIPIYANDVLHKEDGTWNITYKDESGFGHDKSRTIRKYTNKEFPPGSRPYFFYCGDGVSDLSAARETDLLFAKEGKDLITYCENEGIPFTVFQDFKEIHKHVQDIIEGKRTIKDVMQDTSP